MVDVAVSDEMSESFLAYSLSVITARAIPDVRDGLKPVQRRILYSMLRQNIRPDSTHRKCAGVVGDTMGKYHPHGDSAIYEALVRMGQDFTRNVTFIDPQGNFGTLDDPPAAYRYTECRLTDAAMDMVREIDENTVSFRPTFDAEREEPVFLPALVPNLLINGTTGIAVGMATNMPTHNLREVYDAIELVMTKRRPKPTISELRKVLPGPDFPGGGIVIDDGPTLDEIYETGRGSVRMRARVETIQITRNRQGLVVTELPHMVGPERVIAKIQDLVNSGKLHGIQGLADLSDRKQGLRLQIECKPNINPEAVLAELYRLTPLEETFGVNNVVLVDNVPTTLGLYDLCQHYITHRLDMIVRRTQFRLERAQERMHIVEGFLIALDNIDEVIAIIRASADSAEARENLMTALSLSEIQAREILEMPLRRLTALERQKLVDEHDELAGKIAEFEKLLGSEKRQRTLVLAELREAVEAYGEDRKTEIVPIDDIPTFEVIDLVDTDIEDEPCVVTLSTTGQIGRAPLEGAKRGTPGRHDVLVSSTLTSTRSKLWAITTEGRALAATAAEVGEVAGRSRGSDAKQIFGLNAGEQVLTVLTPNEEHLVLVTEQGVAKRLHPDEVAKTKSGGTVIKLKGNDRLAAAFVAPEGIDIVIVANDAQALRTAIDKISVQGKGAGGVSGMKLRDGATVIAAGPVIGDAMVCSVTSSGAGKTTPLSELDSKGRGGVGVRLTKLDAETLKTAVVGDLPTMLAVMSTDDDHGKVDPVPVAFPVEPSKRDLVSTELDRPILNLGPARW